MNTQTTTCKARPFSLTTRLHASVKDHHVTDGVVHDIVLRATSAGEGYLIYDTRVLPDDLRHDTITRWELSEFPGRTNMSHEEKLHGWLGTSCGVQRVAAGYVRILRAGPRTVRVVEEGWSREAHEEELAEIAARLAANPSDMRARTDLHDAT